MPDIDVQTATIISVDCGREGGDESVVILGEDVAGEWVVHDVVRGAEADAMIAALDAYPIGVSHA